MKGVYRSMMSNRSPKNPPPQVEPLRALVLSAPENNLLNYNQGTHWTGKTGKMATTKFCQGKHRKFGNFAKTQGVWFAQLVNSLILKVKDISIFV